MQVSVIRIGNSKGIRIPKNVLSQLRIEDKLELEVRENEILLKPIEKKTREGWREALASMREKDDDVLLFPNITDEEPFDWEWE